MKQIEEKMRKIKTTLGPLGVFEMVVIKESLESIALSARTELIKEIRDKMPKKQKDNLPDEIGGYPIDKEGFETFHRGFNSCLSEFESIINKLK